MRWVSLSFLCLYAGCFYSSAWGKNQHQQQSEAKKQLLPANFQAQQGANGPVRTFTLRVYADQDHRKQVRRWKSKFESLLTRVNKVTEANFAARLEISDFREWERHSAPDSLDAIQRELEALDRGDDVDWVVGMVSALPQATSRHSQLGVADLVGKHFVLRGMNDLAEERALDAYFSTLSDDERRDLYTKRKAHKKLAVFLHEWAHTLGALHIEGKGWLMNAGYDSEARAFSPSSQWIIKIALAGRGPGENREKRLRASQRDQYIAYQKYGVRAGWSKQEIRLAMEVLEAQGASENGPSAPASSTQASVPEPNSANTGSGSRESAAAKESTTDRAQAVTWMRRGQSAEARGEWAAAAKAYDRATRLSPKLDDAWRGLIRAYTKLGDSDALEAAYDRYKSR